MVDTYDLVRAALVSAAKGVQRIEGVPCVPVFSGDQQGVQRRIVLVVDVNAYLGAVPAATTPEKNTRAMNAAIGLMGLRALNTINKLGHLPSIMQWWDDMGLADTTGLDGEPLTTAARAARINLAAKVERSKGGPLIDAVMADLLRFNVAEIQPPAPKRVADSAVFECYDEAAARAGELVRVARNDGRPVVND